MTCSTVVHRTIPRDRRVLCAFLTSEAFLLFVWPIIQRVLVLVLNLPLFSYLTRIGGDFVSTALQFLFSGLSWLHRQANFPSGIPFRSSTLLPSNSDAQCS